LAIDHRMRKSILAAAAFVVLLLTAAAPALAQSHSSHVRQTEFRFTVATQHVHKAPLHGGPVAKSAAVTCDKVASPGGSDVSGDGTPSSPYASVGKLDASLSPGQTGCLETGTYGSTSTEFYLTNSGTAGGQITITSYPGEQAKLVGFVDLMASYTTLSGLNIDGSNTFYTFSDNFNPCNRTGAGSQALQINGNDDIFQDNDYYQSVAALRSVGIGVGFNGPANDTIIRYNRVHDVGSCMAYDHLIYLDSGNGAQIYDNWLYNDPHGFGVQVYPSASGAHIFDNVIDHAGSGITVGGTSATSNNVIDHNVITNSTGLPDAGTTGQCVSDWWEGAPGTNNTFSDNDCYADPDGVGSTSAVTMSGNSTKNPKLTNPSNDDFAVRSGSPAGGWNLWNGVSS
jgi:hypothetical protein